MATLAVIETDGANPGRQDSLFNLGPGAHQCWYPIALSERVPVGKIVGRDLADGRIMIYRGEDGGVRVMSAYCKHMGADLSVGGQVIGNNVRCPYHHWQYGDGGHCKTIPSGDTIPPKTNLFEFPVREQFGLIWIFFGETPLYEVQGFSEFDQEKHIAKSYEIELCEPLQAEPWMFTTNVFDFVHLKFLHHVDVSNSAIEVLDPFRYRMSWNADMGEKAKGAWRPEILVYGMNSIRTMGDQDGRLKWYIAASVPLGREGTKFFVTIITTRGEGDVEFLDRMAVMHNAIMNEDVPVLNNLRYGDFHLVKSDQPLMRFLRTVPKYPRTTLKELEKNANAIHS